MKTETKQAFLHAAEAFDAWRVIPRLALISYAYFVWYTTTYIMIWYTNQPAGARGVEESGTVAAVFAIVTGLAPWVFKIYSDNGRDWSATPAPQVQSTTIQSTTTIPQS